MSSKEMPGSPGGEADDGLLSGVPSVVDPLLPVCSTCKQQPGQLDRYSPPGTQLFVNWRKRGVNKASQLPVTPATGCYRYCDSCC